MSRRTGRGKFRPRARILKLLGEELITDEVIALVELVKNSYDADANNVTVHLENITTVEDGKITIRDDGLGMSLDTVLSAWLEPGTSFRKSQREAGERSKKYKRKLLGEKGVGRFAAQKLGTMITLTTRNEYLTEDGEWVLSDEEIIIEVDWSVFDEDKYLSDVEVGYSITSPNEFRESSGTLIEINFIRSDWTKNKVLNLAQQLEGLESPFSDREKQDGPAVFNLDLKCKDFSEIIENIRPVSELLKDAIYKFTGSVNEEGILNAYYEFYNPAFPQLKRPFGITDLDIRDPEYFEENKEIRVPKCGRLDFEYYVWDLDSKTLSETITRKTYNEFIKPHTGLRVYRDGFRVWPYGEPGNDWLNMDSRRVNNPKKVFSNNQIIGMVEITVEQNPKLKDKTDREGLILNNEYNDFTNIVLSSISEFEILRRRDKDIIDNLRVGKGKQIDDTINEIEKLETRMKKDAVWDKYKNFLSNIEKAYHIEITNTLEPLIVSAGIGIAYQMPAHEISIQIDSAKDLLNQFKSELVFLDIGGSVADRVPNLFELLDNVGQIAEGALELTRRKSSEVKLRNVIEFSRYIKEPEMKRNGITYVYNELEEITIKGYQNLIMSCLLNIFDNSIYWLRKKAENRIVKVTTKTIENEPTIIISDNGPGIDRSDIAFLGEAYYTKKPHGTGLGLFICKRAMKRNIGRLDFGFYPNDPDYLEGANVVLTFSKEVRII